MPKGLVWLVCIVVLALTGVAAPVFADAISDGNKAYDNGDYDTARSLWQPLAEQGNAEAQNLMGNIYRRGRGVPRDYRIAASWFRKSAKQNNAQAQFNLAGMYRAGKGVPKDPKEAAHWFLEAARNGYDKAQFSIGLMYENGWGVDKDLVKKSSAPKNTY